MSKVYPSQNYWSDYLMTMLWWFLIIIIDSGQRSNKNICKNFYNKNYSKKLSLLFFNKVASVLSLYLASSWA